MPSGKYRILAAALVLFLCLACFTCYVQAGGADGHDSDSIGMSARTEMFCALSPRADTAEVSAQPITPRAPYEIALCRTAGDIKSLSCEAHSKENDRTDSHRPSLSRLCRMTSGDPDSGY